MWLNDPIENIHIQWDMIILIIFLTSFSKLSDIHIQPESEWLQNILLLMKNKYNIQNYCHDIAEILLKVTLNILANH